MLTVPISTEMDAKIREIVIRMQAISPGITKATFARSLIAEHLKNTEKYRRKSA